MAYQVILDIPGNWNKQRVQKILEELCEYAEMKGYIMGLVAAQKPKSPPIPGGTYQGVCYQVIDIGTHLNNMSGTDQRKIVIVWEVPSLRIKITKDGKEMDLPRVIHKEYTLSLDKKANLFKDLTSWRGTPFTPEELKGFDVRKVLKANCILQVINVETESGLYANVSGVMKLMDGMTKKEPENKPVTYSIEDDGENFPETIPTWIKEKIHASKEFSSPESDAGAVPDFDAPPATIGVDEIPFD